jgi:uncharacterized membrane protein
MTDVLVWLLITAAQAALLHLAAVWYFPRLISLVSARKLLRFSGRWNILGYRGLPMAGRRALTSNPDMATAFGVYDAAEGPVRIACTLPESDNYWSISLYAWNTENYYVMSDRMAPAKAFDLVIVGSRSQYSGSPKVSAQREEVVLSPSKKGVILVRMVVHDREDERELERVEEAIKKTVIISGSAHSLPVFGPVSSGARI